MTEDCIGNITPENIRLKNDLKSDAKGDKLETILTKRYYKGRSTCHDNSKEKVQLNVICFLTLLENEQQVPSKWQIAY